MRGKLRGGKGVSCVFTLSFTPCIVRAGAAAGAGAAVIPVSFNLPHEEAARGPRWLLPLQSPQITLTAVPLPLSHSRH